MVRRGEVRGRGRGKVRSKGKVRCRAWDGGRGRVRCVGAPPPG